MPSKPWTVTEGKEGNINICDSHIVLLFLFSHWLFVCLSFLPTEMMKKSMEMMKKVRACVRACVHSVMLTIARNRLEIS